MGSAEAEAEEEGKEEAESGGGSGSVEASAPRRRSGFHGRPWLSRSGGSGCDSAFQSSTKTACSGPTAGPATSTMQSTHGPTAAAAFSRRGPSRFIEPVKAISRSITASLRWFRRSTRRMSIRQGLLGSAATSSTPASRSRWAWGDFFRKDRLPSASTSTRQATPRPAAATRASSTGTLAGPSMKM